MCCHEWSCSYLAGFNARCQRCGRSFLVDFVPNGDPRAIALQQPCNPAADESQFFAELVDRYTAKRKRVFAELRSLVPAQHPLHTGEHLPTVMHDALLELQADWDLRHAVSSGLASGTASHHDEAERR